MVKNVGFLMTCPIYRFCREWHHTLLKPVLTLSLSYFRSNMHYFPLTARFYIVSSTPNAYITYITFICVKDKNYIGGYAMIKISLYRLLQC